MTERSTKTMIRDTAHSAVVPGSRVIRSAELAYVGGRPAATTLPSCQTNHATPTVELVTEAGIVRAIDVTCACGNKIRIWCSYETNGESPPQNAAQ